MSTEAYRTALVVVPFNIFMIWSIAAGVLLMRRAGHAVRMPVSR